MNTLVTSVLELSVLSRVMFTHRTNPIPLRLVTPSATRRHYKQAAGKIRQWMPS